MMFCMLNTNTVRHTRCVGQVEGRLVSVGEEGRFTTHPQSVTFNSCRGLILHGHQVERPPVLCVWLVLNAKEFKRSLLINTGR